MYSVNIFKYLNISPCYVLIFIAFIKNDIMEKGIINKIK